MSYADIKPQPQDAMQRIVPLPSSSKHLTMITATGGWNTVSLPAGTDCKSVMIQVHNGIESDFTSYAANPPVFHLTFNAGTDWTQHVGSFSFDIVQAGGTNLCSVRAASGNKIAVFISA